MKMDIAIIGMAGVFPGAKNIEELYKNLRNGVDTINPLSPKRIKDTCLPANKEYRVCGYMDDIDKFDYELFNISYSEAINMSPAQRLLLQTVYETFENAGYGIDYFNGSNTSIYAADTISTNYFEHADEFSPTLTTGNSREFLASKIARHFNLLGSSIVINTACSASAVAVKLACNELILGDADYAVVCGVNFDLFPYKTDSDGFGVISKSGKSKAFSSESDGMSFGETSCAILLKPLDKAIDDKDIIHAVIKSASVNNNGMRSSSILAPDSIMQAKLMQKAWNKISITPEDIGFIEAHGSGTDLGDCLEVEGLTLAIKEYTPKKQFIPISTIKSNIGHCMLCAGIVSIVKTVLSLKHKELFPNINCKELNPKINFEQSPVYVNRELKKWEIKDSKPRYAGVTSLGRSGVNSHIVLQEYNELGDEPENSEGKEFLITLSSNTKDGLKRNADRLLDYLKTNNSNMENISYTLNTGRHHYKYRYATIVSGTDELITKLNDGIKTETNKHDNYSFFFILSDQVITEPLFNYFYENYPSFREHADDIKKKISLEKNSLSPIFQYSLYKMLINNHIPIKSIISAGIGKLVKKFVLDEISEKMFINEINNYDDKVDNDFYDKATAFLNKQSGKQIVLVDIGFESKITKTLKSIKDGIKSVSLSEIHLKEGKGIFINYIKSLYLNNLDADWNKFFSKTQHGRKIELPAYSFEKIRCWLRDEPKEDVVNEIRTDDTFKLLDGETDIEYLVGSVFGTVLNVNSLSVNDNFFDKGGDSLKASKVIQNINKAYNFNFDFEDLFDFPTIKKFADHIMTKTNTETVLATVWKSVLGIEEIKPDDCFFDLGGHSLIATQVINRIKQLFNIEIDFEDIYANSKLRELSRFIDDQKKQAQSSTNTFNGINSAEKKDYYPTSYTQRRMLYLEQMYNSGTSYNNPMFFRINGSLDIKHLENTFNKLIEQHELFRTSFSFIKGSPFQKINKKVKLKIDYKDLSGNPEQEMLVKEETGRFVKPFDLTKLPFLRVGVIKLDADKWLLMYDINHIISDRATNDLLIKDFLLLYNNIELKPQKIQYKDFSVWEEKYFKSEEFLKKEKFWLEVFKKEPEALQLPVDFKRPEIMDYRGDEYTFIVDEDLTNKLKNLSKEQGVTMFVLLLAIFKVFLHKLTGQTDICIGSPYSLRNQVDLEKMVGVLLNTIVFRSNPTGEKSFKQYLHEIKDFSLKAYDNHQYPFEMLLEKINYKRKPDRTPVFDILFNSQTSSYNNDTIEMHDDDKKLEFIPDRQKEKASAFDMSLMLDFSGSIIHFIVHFKTSLFENSTIKNFMNEYKLLMEQIVNDPEKLLKNYNIFNQARRNKIKITNQLN